MSRILFSHSYFLRFDPKQWSLGQPYAPLGTLYAASLLRASGYEVRLLDTMFAYGPEEVIPVLQEYVPDYFVLYDDGFNYLTKMCLTNMREAAFEMIRLARQKGCRVIVCSSDATDQFEAYLAEGAHYIIMGEGEQTLLELIQNLEAGETNQHEISGLSFTQKNAVIKTAKRPVMKDLDALPFPAWDLIDITPYRKAWLKSTGYFSLNMATTRGCPFKCNWCAKPIYGNRYNCRSPKNVTDELVMLQEKFGFEHIWFCDDIFGLKPGWVAEFAEEVQKAGLSFRFKIQARVDLMVQENYVRDLALAGCENVWMGAESGSQKILDAMNKGTTVEQIYQSAALLKQYGIKPSFFIQFGYPGETKQDIALTLRMIRELMPHEIGISVSYPLPGTPFFERVKNELREKANWTDSDELALLFHNTYAPVFYKQLHRYVHHEFRKYQGLHTLKQAVRKPLAQGWRDWKKIMASGWYALRSLQGRIKLNRYAR